MVTLVTYLCYKLTEAVRNHSSLSVIRDRLNREQREAIHSVLLGALQTHGLIEVRRFEVL